MTPLPASGEVTVEAGRYRHYKGKDYLVVGMARHSETHEMMVVYRPLYGPQVRQGGQEPPQESGQEPLWVRPAAMFIEDVMIDGKTQPRFARQS